MECLNEVKDTKGMLYNLFSETEKHLTLKSYFFVVILFWVYLGLINLGMINSVISPKFIYYSKKYIGLIFICFIYRFIFKEKFETNQKTLVKFLINGILGIGIFAYAGLLLQIPFRNVVFMFYDDIESYESFFLSAFKINSIRTLIQVIDCFVFFSIITAILSFTGRETICFTEGIKIFGKSIGKLFTFVYLWLLTWIYDFLIDDVQFFHDNMVQSNFFGKFFIIAEMMIMFYFVYAGFVFALAMFKVYYTRDNNTSRTEEAE